MPISIHALLAESDVMDTLILADAVLFLSTLSLRRATPAEHHASTQQEFLSTLSLRRATNGHETAPYRVGISIHALLAESDPRGGFPVILII